MSRPLAMFTLVGVLVFTLGGPLAAVAQQDSTEPTGSPVQLEGTTSLIRALESAEPGDTIEVEDGRYELVIENASFDPPVTIEATSGAELQELRLSSVQGLTFVGFTFPTPVSVSESQAITFSDGISLGGFDIDDSDGISLVRMEISEVDVPDAPPYEKGISASGVTDLSILDSWFHAIPEDGIQLSDVSGAVITGNRFEDIGPWNGTVARDRHSDVLQILSGVDIVFADNVVTGNNHSLMIKSDFGPIERITIERNLFETNDGWAIQLIGVSDVVLSDNTYDCNGEAWASPCEETSQFDVRTTDTTGLVRNDTMPTVPSDAASPSTVGPDGADRPTPPVDERDDIEGDRPATLDTVDPDAGSDIAAEGPVPPADSDSATVFALGGAALVIALGLFSLRRRTRRSP